eukprot:SAG11_NODE_281_length_11257_cov_45.949633_3_plen_78_part_00
MADFKRQKTGVNTGEVVFYLNCTRKCANIILYSLQSDRSHYRYMPVGANKTGPQPKKQVGHGYDADGHTPPMHDAGY